ncbi:hypothetical protein PVAR5_4254 [Paecilomyces variotii No. 5]|uniref:Zn(2)-C6 fungal-type domain-containing protein n=1 Tax=Byssochlamys spectabilis (strain No. 5 / NBRC 109023) TaxID=1356009 RepID=V5FU75_BYSSN|nr:hypothetical protein PVAR5_4254 [Paecilomyces variotii No. 5]
MSGAPRSRRDHDEESTQNTIELRRMSSFGPFREILSRGSAPLAHQSTLLGAAGVPSPVSRKSNVSLACTPCRRLKTKCDGQNPCSNCSLKKTEGACTYDTDNRRKGILKRMLHDSQQENAQLQGILEYLRSSSTQAAAALLGRIRRGLTAEELTRYIETVGSSSTSISPAQRSVSQSTSDLLTGQTSSWTRVTEDGHLVKHLVDLYFCWQHQCVPVLCKSQFINDMQSGNGDFCSSILVNAILAVGSLFYESHDQSESPQDVQLLGEDFMQEADRLIQEELMQGRSSLTTVQALVIMSTRDVAAGKEAIMWFHLGLAIVMAINLVLDMDDSANDSVLRQCERATYWGLFIADRLAAFVSGRLPQMRTANSPAKPQDRPADDDLWSPIISSIGEPQFSRPENSAEVVPFQYELLEIIDDMLSIFYLPGKNPKVEDINLLHTRLVQWRGRQPAGLDLGPFAVPNVFHLRLLYHATVLMLFRTYLHSSASDLSVQPAMICKDSASGILEAVTLYDQCYGIRYAPVLYLNHIYAAAFVHASELPKDQSLESFLQCMRYIKTMGVIFKRPAEMAFTTMFSILLEKQISLPSKARDELTGVVALDTFESLFVEKTLEASGHEPYSMPALEASGTNQLSADGGQQTSGHTGSLSLSGDQEGPVEDFLVGELTFGSGLLPDLLDDYHDNTLDENW